MQRYVIPVYLHFDYETYELESDEKTEAIFYVIHSVMDYVDMNGNVKGTEINCNGIVYISPMTKREIDSLIMYNNQDL